MLQVRDLNEELKLIVRQLLDDMEQLVTWDVEQKSKALALLDTIPMDQFKVLLTDPLGEFYSLLPIPHLMMRGIQGAVFIKTFQPFFEENPNKVSLVANALRTALFYEKAIRQEMTLPPLLFDLLGKDDQYLYNAWKEPTSIEDCNEQYYDQLSDETMLLEVSAHMIQTQNLEKELVTPELQVLSFYRPMWQPDIDFDAIKIYKETMNSRKASRGEWKDMSVTNKLYLLASQAAKVEVQTATAKNALDILRPLQKQYDENPETASPLIKLLNNIVGDELNQVLETEVTEDLKPPETEDEKYQMQERLMTMANGLISSKGDILPSMQGNEMKQMLSVFMKDENVSNLLETFGEAFGGNIETAVRKHLENKQ